jgi:hypothetical protein
MIDVIVMGRLALNDSTQRQHCSELTGTGQLSRHDGEFETPGNPAHGNVLSRDTMSSESLTGTVSQTGRYEIVEARDNDRKPVVSICQ